DVPGADHDRELEPALPDIDDLVGDRVQPLRVEAVLSRSHQRLAGELEQGAAEGRRRLLAGWDAFRYGSRLAHSASANRANSSTPSPSSSRACPTVRPGSCTQDWSARTDSAKKRLASMPSTIFPRTASGFDCTSGSFS